MFVHNHVFTPSTESFAPVAVIKESLGTVGTEPYPRERYQALRTWKLLVIGGPETAVIAENGVQLC